METLFQTCFGTAAVQPEKNDGVVLTRPGESMTVQEFLDVHVRRGVPFDVDEAYRRASAVGDVDESFDDSMPEADYDLSNASQDAQKVPTYAQEVDESVLP